MKRHTFIIRIVTDDEGSLRGQLTEPVSGRQVLFSTPAELWVALTRHLSASPQLSPPPEKPVAPIVKE